VENFKTAAQPDPAALALCKGAQELVDVIEECDKAGVTPADIVAALSLEELEEFKHTLEHIRDSQPALQAEVERVIAAKLDATFQIIMEVIESKGADKAEADHLMDFIIDVLGMDATADEIRERASCQIDWNENCDKANKFIQAAQDIVDLHKQGFDWEGQGNFEFVDTIKQALAVLGEVALDLMPVTHQSQ
jgi:DNA-binding transcriptional MerR regulator